MKLKEKGHNVKFISVNKDVMNSLLNTFDVDYISLGDIPSSQISKILTVPSWTLKTLQIASKFKPDMFVSRALPHFAYASWILRKPFLIFEDTEHATKIQSICFPFAKHIITPNSYLSHIGNKQIRFNGFSELAYLHPNYFTPNPAVLQELGLEEGDPFIIMRFVSWDASHDIGHHGIQNKIEFVKELEKYGRVLITSEGDMGPEFEKYKIKVSPEKLHDLLYYATLYIGEGGTTASEAATLGTHAIHISTTAKYCGLFNMLHDYGLMWTFDDEKGVINISKNLLQERDLWKIGKEKRDSMVEDYLDVTDFMVRVIDEYPKSLQTIQQRKKYVGDN
jgi:predicted glycosyltransferase